MSEWNSDEDGEGAASRAGGWVGAQQIVEEEKQQGGTEETIISGRVRGSFQNEQVRRGWRVRLLPALRIDGARHRLGERRRSPLLACRRPRMRMCMHLRLHVDVHLPLRAGELAPVGGLVAREQRARNAVEAAGRARGEARRRGLSVRLATTGGRGKGKGNERRREKTVACSGACGYREDPE